MTPEQDVYKIRQKNLAKKIGLELLIQAAPYGTLAMAVVYL